MTRHSSILAWRIPWTEKPGGLQSVGSQSLTLCYALGFSASAPPGSPSLSLFPAPGGGGPLGAGGWGGVL